MDQENNEVDKNLGMFEAAFRAQPKVLVAPIIKNIVVFRDGSDQDESALALAKTMATKFDANLKEIDAPVLGMDAAAKVGLFDPDADAADLVVLPAPFGEDLGTLKRESLSSVVDIFLTETRTPVLIARHPISDPADTLKRPVVLVDWDSELQVTAASFACHFAGSDGNVDLIATIDPSTLAEIYALIGDNEDDREAFQRLIQRAETRLSGGLIAAVQKLESTQGFSSHFDVEQDQRSSGAVASRALQCLGFAVCAYRASAHSPSLNRLRDLILESTQPVLCLPI